MRIFLLAGSLVAALAIAGCGDETAATSDGAGASATQPSKQGTTNAQTGELQPPPNAPNPDAMMGKRSGG